MERVMNASAESKLKKLVRTTESTKFHIDYDWWELADRDLDVYLRSHLCAEHQSAFADINADEMVDTVHPETAEVSRVLGIQHTLLTPQTTLVNAVFRVFLSNGNNPLSPTELGERLNRPARMILRTLSGPRVYKGIRPVSGE
jgi:hypothetical protein